MSGTWISRRPLWHATLGVMAGILSMHCPICAFGQPNVLDDDAIEFPQPIIGPEIFDGYVFPQYGGGQGSLRMRKRLQDEAHTRIATIDRWCTLSDPQKQKLQLAARGDIARVFDRVDIARAQFERQRLSRVEPQQIYLNLQRLRLTIASDPFVGKSLLRKTLVAQLTPEQLAKYRAAERDERQNRNRPHIDNMLNELQNVRFNELGLRENRNGIVVQKPNPEKPAPLTLEQKERLTKMIAEEIPLTHASHPYHMYCLRYQCGRIPAEKWQSILNEKQWAHFSPKLQQYERYKTVLERVGLFPIDPDDELLPERTVPAVSAAAGGTK